MSKRVLDETDGYGWKALILITAIWAIAIIMLAEHGCIRLTQFITGAR